MPPTSSRVVEVRGVAAVSAAAAAEEEEEKEPDDDKEGRKSRHGSAVWAIRSVEAAAVFFVF